MLALNIRNKDFLGLFQPLDYNQGAPIGFLLVEKLLVSIFGDNEMVLRFFPFIAGLVGMWLFYLLLQKTVSSKSARLVTLGIFVVHSRLISSSAEVKQYSVDVLMAIALLYFAVPLFEKPVNTRKFYWMSITGIIAMWFSHPALFVLAGIGLSLFLLAFWQRYYSRLVLLIYVGTIWVANLGFLYLISLQNLSRNEYLLDYWQEGFAPIPPWSNWAWFSEILGGGVLYALGYSMGIQIAALVILVGWIVLILKKNNLALILPGIMVITLVASSLRLYPIFGRMILFLTPPALLFVAFSLDGLGIFFSSQRLLNTIFVIFIGLYFLYLPANIAIENFITPKYVENIRPTLDFLELSWQDEDALYISHWAVPAFHYYSSRYHLENISFVTSTYEDYTSPDQMLLNLDTLTGRQRVWILISHVHVRGEFNEKEYLLNYLDAIGKLNMEYRNPGAGVFLYLYDLH